MAGLRDTSHWGGVWQSRQLCLAICTVYVYTVVHTTHCLLPTHSRSSHEGLASACCPSTPHYSSMAHAACCPFHPQHLSSFQTRPAQLNTGDGSQKEDTTSHAGCSALPIQRVYTTGVPSGHLLTAQPRCRSCFSYTNGSEITGALTSRCTATCLPGTSSVTSRGAAPLRRTRWVLRPPAVGLGTVGAAALNVSQETEHACVCRLLQNSHKTIY